jgi:four helix bundle protein
MGVTFAGAADMGSYQDLPLWQRAMELAEVIHRDTVDLPLTDQLSLVRQLRRLACAIPWHVAAFYSPRAATFLRGLRRARHALRQLEHQVLLADRLQFWSEEQRREICRCLAEVHRHLRVFFRSLCPPRRPGP